MEEVESKEGATGEEVTPEGDKPPEPREEVPSDPEMSTMRLRARLTKKYYNALKEEGFDNDQCLSIIGGRCSPAPSVPVPKEKEE